MTESVQAHPGFEFVRQQAIASLNIRVQEFRHRATGAQHIHLASDSPENVFLVALRTVPEDSTGVAHILEHTALCGSEKYPVRDPFFMMIRRSLNTFMNAMTSSDWTAYPFASLNRKDYFNLLDVYLDAVFFSRLDELDFCQEGHRLEFEVADNPDSPLMYKGVVYNEMKGAMSSVPATLWQTLCKYVFPTTTYHYNSGGDPECITDLSYAQLREFYRTHYHPSNATFMTFGDIPAAELQARFEEQALARFERLDHGIQVPLEKRYLAPVRVEEYYALDEDGDIANKTHHVIAWLLGDATDQEAVMKAHLLNSVLLDNSASPLQKALETTALGSAPSPLCGLDDSMREMLFVCGIEGSNPDSADAFEQMVSEVLEEVADNGIPQEQLEASLHQIELQVREITGDAYPYGLQLLISMLTHTTHGGDPVAQLDLEPVLLQLREAIRDPDFIKRLARELLVDNLHRVRLTLRPDTALSARRQQAEEQRLAAIKTQLSDSEKQQLVERAAALIQRQAQKDDDAMLPKVTLADVQSEMSYTAAERRIEEPVPLTRYRAGTNGLVYQQLVMTLPHLEQEHLQLLPLYTSFLTEFGVGERDYLDTQLWQSRICGALNAFVSVRGRPDNVERVNGHMVLSSKGLAANQSAITDLMADTLNNVRFDELSRLRELVAQSKARRVASVTGNGHGLAMNAATSGFSPGACLSHNWGGLGGIRFIKTLDQALADETALQRLADQFRTIHEQITRAERQLLLVGEAEHLDGFTHVLLDRFGNPAAGQDITPFSLTGGGDAVHQVWKTSTQVNFCARAYPTVPMDHPDAAALNVLGGFLRNGFLHRAIREQGGAYGGGAGQDNNIAAFRFFSYRDPRHTETLDDFDRSLEWLSHESHDWNQVEEAILGVISAIDKPGSPAGEARQTFHAELYGRSREKRERFRQRVLEVSLDDLRRVAATYFNPERASTAVITSPEQAPRLVELGLEEISL